MDKIEIFAVEFEKLTSLIQLSAYMKGRINIDDLPSNEKIAEKYPCWLESLLDVISERATAMDKELEKIIKSMPKG